MVNRWSARWILRTCRQVITGSWNHSSKNPGRGTGATAKGEPLPIVCPIRCARSLNNLATWKNLPREPTQPVGASLPPSPKPQQSTCQVMMAKKLLSKNQNKFVRKRSQGKRKNRTENPGSGRPTETIRTVHTDSFSGWRAGIGELDHH